MIITAVLCFSITGLTLGILLAVANRFLRVHVDPREEEILNILPGINCGACGYPGCAGYAAAIVSKSEEVNKCTPGGEDAVKKMGAVMGVKVEVLLKRTARVFCNGGKDKSPERFHYTGISSCAAVHITAGGNKACSYGCLGLGDCFMACPFNAIRMREDGIPEINPDACTACGKCVSACPRNLISIIPVEKKVIIACNSKDSGPETRKTCKVGCTACRLCVKACPSNAITVEENLARINSQTCTLARACIPKCPQKTIIEFSK